MSLAPPTQTENTPESGPCEHNRQLNQSGVTLWATNRDQTSSGVGFPQEGVVVVGFACSDTLVAVWVEEKNIKYLFPKGINTAVKISSQAKSTTIALPADNLRTLDSTLQEDWARLVSQGARSEWRRRLLCKNNMVLRCFGLSGFLGGAPK